MVWRVFAPSLTPFPAVREAQHVVRGPVASALCSALSAALAQCRATGSSVLDPLPHGAVGIEQPETAVFARVAQDTPGNGWTGTSEASDNVWRSPRCAKITSCATDAGPSVGYAQ